MRVRSCAAAQKSDPGSVQTKELARLCTRTRIALTSISDICSFPTVQRLLEGSLLDRPQRKRLPRFQSGISVVKKIKPSVATGSRSVLLRRSRSHSGFSVFRTRSKEHSGNCTSSCHRLTGRLSTSSGCMQRTSIPHTRRYAPRRYADTASFLVSSMPRCVLRGILSHLFTNPSSSCPNI